MAADKDRGRATAGLRAGARLRHTRGSEIDGDPARYAEGPYVEQPYAEQPYAEQQPYAEPRYVEDPHAGDPHAEHAYVDDPDAEHPYAEHPNDRRYADSHVDDDRYRGGADYEMDAAVSITPPPRREGLRARPAPLLIEAPRRTWGRRWMRRAGICAGSLAAVVILAATGLGLLLANGPISLDLATPWIADAVADNLGTGYHVDIGGTVLEYDEHGRPAMRIRAITVRDHDGTVVASAPKAEVGFSGDSLVRGHLRAQSLELVGAEVAIRVETDGRITMSTHAGDDAPLAVAPAPATDPRSAPLADGVAALAAGGSEAPRGVAEILAAFLTWVDSLHGLDGGDLTEVGLKRGNLVVDDRRNGQQSRFENIHLILSRPSAGALEFELGSDDPGHPGLLLAAIRPGDDGGRIVDLDARRVLLKDILLAARMDGGQVTTDVALSARVHADLTADGQPRTAAGRIDLGPGSFTDSGDPQATIAIDSAVASFDWNAAERLFTLPLEVRSGRTRLPLTAQAEAPKEPGGKWTLSLTNTGPAVFAPASAGEQPLVLNRLVLQGAVDQAAQRFSIERFDATGKGVALAISGSLDYATSDPRLKVHVATRKMPLAAFKAVWPPVITPPVRAWIAERTSGGMIEQAEITTDALLSTLRSGGPPVPPEGLSIVIRTTGGTVQAFDNLPPIRDVDLVSRTRGQNVSVTVAHGTVEMSQGRRVTLSNATFDVPDTQARNPPARVQAKIDGPVPAVAEYLAMDRLKDAAGFAIDPAASRGNVNATVTLGLRLGQDITSSNLNYAITADVTNFAADHFVMSQKVESPFLHVVASDTQGAHIKGDVRVAGTPATVELHRGPNESEAEVHLTGTLDDAARTRLGLDSGGAVTGPVAIKMAGRLAPRGDTDSRLAVEADFTPAKIDGPGWTKAPRTPAKASFTYVGRGKPERIDDIVFEGNGAAVRGGMEFSSAGDFALGTFPAFGLSEGDRANLMVERTPEGVYKFTLRGDTFDARNFIRVSLSGNPDPKHRHPPVDIDVDLKLGAVAGGMGEILRNAEARLSRRGGTIRAFSGTARFAGDGVLTGELRVPAPGDRGYPTAPPTLYVESTDAGALFRFSNTYARMNGGRMFIAMDPPGPDGDKVGRIDVRDFTIHGEQALDNIAARAPNGTSLGVPFTHMHADFTRGAGRLSIRNGVAAGPIAGGTIDGVMDYAGNTLHLSGAFVPLYGINTAFAEVPVFSQLLGGQRGMIGSVSYEVSGSPGQPVLTVNPISALAPGFTREILDALKPVPAPPSR